MTNFTTMDLIQQYLGRTLTADQQVRAQTLFPVADAYISRVTRRTWYPDGGAITNERYDLVTPVLYLTSRPVTSITSIAVRTTQVGDTPHTLVAGVDYELVDATRGEVRFASGYGSSEPGYWDPNASPNLFLGTTIALVTYVPNLPVPADIAEAATQIVGHSLALALFPDRMGISKAQVDESTSITYTDAGTTVTVPQSASEILRGYRSGRLILA